MSKPTLLEVVKEQDLQGELELLLIRVWWLGYRQCEKSDEAMRGNVEQLKLDLVMLLKTT